MSGKEEIANEVARINKRGPYGYDNDIQKQQAELAAAQDWAIGLKAQWNLDVTDIGRCEKDPPDCEAAFEQRKISIELVQLIDSKRAAEHVKAYSEGRDPPHLHGEGFKNSLWSKERFSNELDNLIDGKNSKYAAIPLFIDVLIVHAASEPWLVHHQIEDWLKETANPTAKSVSKRFFVV